MFLVGTTAFSAIGFMVSSLTTYFANGIRDGMVYGLSIMHSAFWLNLGVLVAWGVAAFIIGSRFYKWKG